MAHPLARPICESSQLHRAAMRQMRLRDAADFIEQRIGILAPHNLRCFSIRGVGLRSIL
jgi:hypothetical protein